jgi:hypothetical protein
MWDKSVFDSGMGNVRSCYSMNRLERAGSQGALVGLARDFMSTQSRQTDLTPTAFYPRFRRDENVYRLLIILHYILDNQPTGEFLYENHCFCRSCVCFLGRTSFC